MKKYIHFWLFGPEFGCVKRQLPIIRHFAHSGVPILLIVHPIHVPLLKRFFDSPNIEIKSYKYSFSLEYDSQLNFRLWYSISGFLNWFLYRWYFDWKTFLKAVKEFPPKLIVHDFLPYVAFWAKLKSIPVFGVYNYCLKYTSFGKGFIARLLQQIILPLFRIAYRLNDKMFIESFVDCQVPHALTIPVIRRYPEQVGISKSEPLHFFLALGGKSNPHKLLAFFSAVHKINPAIKFWIAPRTEDESLPKDEAFEILKPAHPFELGPFWEKVDGVITKAGFSTVAEALQFGKKLFILPLVNHPEIQETAQSLQQLSLAKNIYMNMPFQEAARILNEDFPYSNNKIPFGGETVLIAEIEEMLHSQ